MYDYISISPIGKERVFKNFPELHYDLEQKANLLYVHGSTVLEIIQYMNKWTVLYTRPDGVKINLRFRAVTYGDNDISFLYDFDTPDRVAEASRELEIYVI